MFSSLAGGVETKVEFYRHNVGSEEKELVLECLDGLFLTTGEYVRRFEEEFGKYLNLKHVVGLNSCTAALHLSLLALDIGHGDEVITTPMTFIATATAIMHTGARPIFVDVEPHTGLIDPDKIENAITEKTKAIIPVHLYGQMCDMKRIRALASKYGLRIVEDSAHCIEGRRDGIGPGQLGDVACFSFYATKNITSGEGGAAGTNNKEIAERIRMLRLHGMSEEASQRYSAKYQHWDMIECGWKYNMDNLHAALLMPQLRKIDEYWAARRDIFQVYVNSLRGTHRLTYPAVVGNSKSAYHLFTVWIEGNDRDRIISGLEDSGVGVAVNYRAIHLLTYFKEILGSKKGDFPIAEGVGEKTISLPFYPKLSQSEISYVVSQLKRVL